MDCGTKRDGWPLHQTDALFRFGLCLYYFAPLWPADIFLCYLYEVDRERSKYARTDPIVRPSCHMGCSTAILTRVGVVYPSSPQLVDR